VTGANFFDTPDVAKALLPQMPIASSEAANRTVACRNALTGIDISGPSRDSMDVEKDLNDITVLARVS